MIKFLDIQKITESFEPELMKAVSKVIGRGWFLLGEEVNTFETAYSTYIGTKHCIGVANGLDALRLIFMAYVEMGKIKEGDEVIVPANTYIATILAITDNKLKPILIEPDFNTYNLNISLIEQSITPRTRAIMVVHLYGLACWSKELEDIARRHNLLIIEDNAQATGAMILAQSKNEKKLRRTGSLGNAAGHSFYPGKNLGALGDAGAVTTDDDDLADVVRTIANYGSKIKYQNLYKGLNSRLDEIQAAVLKVKLQRLDADNQRRREIAQFYIDNISNPDIILPGLKSSELRAQGSEENNPTPCAMRLDHIWHLFVIRHNRRDELQKYLSENNVQTLIHYPIPPHKQKAYRDWNYLSFPLTEKIHREVLSLPISQIMPDNEIEAVVVQLNRYKID
jgi:dTDP-4-amino-4,6-dideoxygalactose transaminase